MRTFLSVILLAVTCSASLLPAQGRTGRVRGVVVDSLLGDVLPGAVVQLPKLGRGVTTDSAGRFVIDSVPPGEWAVIFSHPALDSVGVLGSTLTVRVFAGASAFVALGTPAFDPIRRRLCGETPDSLSPTVAFGNVRAADGTRRRVNVSVSWMLGSMSGESARPGTVRTLPEESRQVWIACGIPRDAWFHAYARDSAHTASAFIRMGPRGLAASDLVLSSGVESLWGTVRDAEGRPVPGAYVTVEGTERHATTNAEGAFTVADVPNGTVTVDVRAAGYAPWVAPIVGSDRPVTVQLQPMLAANDDGARGSDYLRLLQRGDRSGIQLLTGAALTSDSAALVTLPLAQTCRWWLDGRPVAREFFVAQPRWTWRALELYPRGQDAPPEYRTADCPVALLWTTFADW
ncbi:MAG TPA: carboxypeptidase regulatory-like domain-containing protein [Gemmatimonadaceae bacterium]